MARRVIARFEKVVADPGRSFRLVETKGKRFGAPWHFHPEIELTLILSGRGRRFVGDSIEFFEAGDLVLLGAGLAHFWHTEGVSRPGDRSHAVVAQFEADFLGPQFIQRAETAPLRRLLDRANRGLLFSGAKAKRGAGLLQQAVALKGFPSLLKLLEALHELSGARARLLVSESYVPRLKHRSERRLGRVYRHLSEHFREPVTLPEIARVAAMSPAAFSRYFKNTAGENFSVTLNRLRVGWAARLLQETDDRVTDIALAAGFATLSNFNRRFLELMGTTPRAFRTAFRLESEK